MASGKRPTIRKAQGPSGNAPDEPSLDFSSIDLKDELLEQGKKLLRQAQVLTSLASKIPPGAVFKVKRKRPSVAAPSPPVAGVRPGLDTLLVRATEVFADQEKALRWLGTPVRALNYATPISLLSLPAGQDVVLAVLNKIEYGVF
jgi:hypothetical protein